MQKFRNTVGLFLFFCSLGAGSSVFVFTGLLLSPSEPGNSIILGLSLPRLAFAVVLLIAFITFITLFVRAFKDHRWAEAMLEQWFGGGRFSRGTIWLAAISFGLSWIGYFLPSYRAGALSNYWPRLQPLMMFVLLLSASVLIVWFWIRGRFLFQELKENKVLRSAFILFLACFIAAGMLLFTKYGVANGEDFWYGAGVPLLASQLLVALLGGVLFLLIERNWNSKQRDLIVFLFIFVVTAILWASEPLQKSFLFIGPHPPNNVLYPYADAATFDAASQFALIGQRIFIFDTPFFERSLYLSFLVYLHSLFGQDYQLLMAAQAAIFGIFPALVYSVGKSLNMRAVGFASAIIAMLRGINSIAASNMIDLANPKMMLTDFPTAIGIALLVLFTCEWLKAPDKKWHYALWVGGIMGMTIMLRTNALLFLLFIPIYALLTFAPQWKKWLRSSILLMLAVVAITIPWELRSASLGGLMYGSITAKIQNVIQQRYTPRPDAGTLLPARFSPFTLQSTQVIVSLYQEESPQPCETVACFASKHFVHNIITSILILPTSPFLDDVHHTVKDNNPFWRPDWDGVFTPSTLVFFLLNLFLITLGISLAWKQQRLIGITPLAIFIFYNVSNALARTSGGRYIVPIDWIIPLYFMMGFLYLINVAAKSVNHQWSEFISRDDAGQAALQVSRSPALTTFLVLAFLFGTGSLLPLSEKLHSPHFSNMDPATLLQEQASQLKNAGLSATDIQSFLQNPDAELVVGRALYPRFFPIGRGEMHFYPYTEMGFPRTGFVVIGPAGEEGVLLPGEAPKHFPHGVDVLVLGCKGQNYTDALAVVVLDETNTVYTRSPASELACPLRQPVCDNNHVCQ